MINELNTSAKFILRINMDKAKIMFNKGAMAEDVEINGKEL